MLSKVRKLTYLASQKTNVPVSRMVLLSLVESADKNANEGMEWEELEDLGNFELIFEKWQKNVDNFPKRNTSSHWHSFQNEFSRNYKASWGSPQIINVVVVGGGFCIIACILPMFSVGLKRSVYCKFSFRKIGLKREANFNVFIYILSQFHIGWFKLYNSSGDQQLLAIRSVKDGPQEKQPNALLFL